MDVSEGLVGCCDSAGPEQLTRDRQNHLKTNSTLNFILSLLHIYLIRILNTLEERKESQVQNRGKNMHRKTAGGIYD